MQWGISKEHNTDAEMLNALHILVGWTCFETTGVQYGLKLVVKELGVEVNVL